MVGKVVCCLLFVVVDVGEIVAGRRERRKYGKLVR